MKLVLGMWLPHLSLERLVDMLGYQFLAMASEAEIEEEPSEQYHYPEQAAVKRAATPVAIKPGTHTWPICLLHRVHPRASVMLLTPELADVPDWATKWFAVAGKVPAKGTALLVTLREDKGDVAYPGMFIELQAPKKLSTGPGESKAMQPVNITIALLLTDEQHNQFAQRPSLPRVSQLEVLPGGASTPLWDALLHMPRERQHVALGVPLEDSPLDAIRQPHWLPGFLTDLVLVLVIGLVVRGNWHDAWAQLIHPEVCQVFRGKHATQAAQASPTAGPGASNTLQNFLNLWLAEEQTYRKEWTPTLLSGVLATLPDSPLPGQEDARTPALWHAERLRLSHDSLSNEHDPRTRASIFALAVGPAFLTCLCDTFWGADGHLAALLGACSYGLAANRTSVFITGAPGSGKTRSCAFLGVLLACLTNRLTLYTAHGNESVRAYVEAVDRLTNASNEFVRSRIVRIPGNKEKDTHKLPFDVHDLYRGLLVATTHGTIVARLSFPYSQLTNRLKDVELLLRDEAQQLGTPGSNTVLAHIKHALDVMIGDHRQPAGGSRPNYHFVTELLEQKTCGLNAVPADLHTPATLPAALLQQVAQSSVPWKKGQGEMPSWGNPHRSSGASEVLFSAVSMLDSILCMSIVKPKQAETVMQAAGLKAIVGPAINLSLCSSMRLPPELAAILYACRYSEACRFELTGGVPRLLMPPGPTLQHLLGRPLRSFAGRWMETCRWVRVPDQDETQTKLGRSYDLSMVLADIVLTFGHQVYPDSPIGMVSQYARLVTQMKFMLQSSLPADPLSLKRFFGAIATACSTGPTFGIGVFVTCRASGFLFSSEAGFARATSSFTRGLGALVFVAPHYSDGIGACFQMAACATGGLIECGICAHTSQLVEHGWPWRCKGITQASLPRTNSSQHRAACGTQSRAGPFRSPTPASSVGLEGHLGR